VRTTRGLLLTALGLGAFGYATQASLFFSALERIDASLVALVLYTYPALVTLAAVLLGRDRLTPARSAALLVASFGTLLVLVGAGGLRFDPIGVAMAFGAAVTYTGYILVADTVVHRLPQVVLSALVMSGAALALAARALASGGVDLGFGFNGWFWIGCIAVVSTVAAILAFFAGLRRTGPSTAAILSTFEPVVTAVLAALVLGELLTPVQLAGGLAVLSSIVVLQLRPRSGRMARPTVQAEVLTGSPQAPWARWAYSRPVGRRRGDPALRRPARPIRTPLDPVRPRAHFERHAMSDAPEQQARRAVQESMDLRDQGHAD
jgi:drug/metabolite transporter (DMT)-like permease